MTLNKFDYYYSLFKPGEPLVAQKLQCKNIIQRVKLLHCKGNWLELEQKQRSPDIPGRLHQLPVQEYLC